MLTGPYNKQLISDAGSGRLPLRRESAMKRAAIYVRVSTDRQTVENQTASHSNRRSPRVADRTDF
jgi:hypothetical protein